jgi:hypothetical protein
MYTVITFTAAYVVFELRLLRDFSRRLSEEGFRRRISESFDSRFEEGG